MEDLSLIDVSGDDDFLLDLASPPQHPDPPPRAATGTSMVVGADLVQPAGGSQAAAARQVPDPSGATEQVPERTESPKKSKPKGGVNLRKSLAWDSAFFTGEGVLDTEELGIVNSTFRKSQGSRLLPGIAEELRRSSESTTSTLESESFVLESLETELFDNVRASIQRTLGKPVKAQRVTAPSSKNSKAPAKAPPVTVRKGVDRISQTQSKIRPPASTSNGCGAGSKQRPQVAPKEPIVAKVAVSKAAEVKPSSRPPRALPRVATMRAPTNSASTSAISDKRSSTGGVVNRQTVVSSANTSASISSRPGGGSKTSSTSNSGALLSAASLGTMPGVKTKSPTLTGKGRAQRIPIRSSSRCDISKVDPARASRSKIPTRSHGEGASPIISPSSSVDSMTSVISGVSTASTIGKASHTSETFSTRSSSLSPSTRKSSDHPLITNRRPLTVTEGTSCDKLKPDIDISTQGNGFKPSGLRRPTPKIGYFDAEKSVEQKAARAQLQPMKVLFSPLATPNPRVSSTPKKNPSFPTFDHQELMSMAVQPSQTKAPSKVMEHDASQTKALPSLLLRVAQTEVESSKVLEHEAHMCEIGPLVAVEESIPALHQIIQASGGGSPLPVELSSCTSGQQESEPEVQTGPLVAMDIAEESIPLPVELSSRTSGQQESETEVKSSKVLKHEAHMCETGPLVTMDIAEESIPLSVELSSCTSGQQEPEPEVQTGPLVAMDIAKESIPLSVELSSRTSGQQESEIEIESSKVLEHEAHMCETGTLVAMDIAEDSIPLPVELSSCTSGQQESETEVELSKVLEHKAHMCETGPLVVLDIAEDSIPALHQTIETIGDARLSILELSSSTFGQQESETTAAPYMESSPSQSKVPASLEVIDDEARIHQACPVSAGADTAKENIPSLHQNIYPSGALSPLKKNILASHHNMQAEGDTTPVKGTILASYPNVQAIGEMTPVTLLTQKLSSISIGPAANGETIETIVDASPSSVELSSSTFGQQESETTAAPHMESSPQSKVPASLEVIDDEACIHQACPVSPGADTAKENIPSLHQNIHPSGAPSPLKKNILASHHNMQAEGDTTPVKGTILASHPNVQAIGEMTPVTLLTQKLSSISIGPAANGEATPSTLLAQKLSSISLGDATD
ncbi:unnamed protein product [Alopecurus aequalis]